MMLLLLGVLALVAAGIVLVPWLLRSGSGRPPPALQNPLPSSTTRPAGGGWQTLERGLELGTFLAPRLSDMGDSRIRVLRIDPAHFRFHLLNASASADGRPLTARQWCVRNGLVAAINASMFQRDRRSSVSFMRTGGHTNNPRISKDKAVLAFDPRAPGARPVRLIDLQFESFPDARRRYGTLIQSIRMLSADGRNVWRPQPKRWSAAVIGEDGRGRILFIHCRSPYRMHDLVNHLRALPIELGRAMYVEGGPEAQLYVRSGGREFELVGSYETGFPASDSNRRARPVPNVVAIGRREPIAG
jgi:hypothetical protein